MNITVVGMGYVGLSNAIILAQNNSVFAVDIIKDRVDMINNKKSPIIDDDIQDFLLNKELNLIASTDVKQAYKKSDFIIIATPTNYDPDKNYFDTTSIESVMRDIIKFNNNATVIIKSTVPIGYTEEIKKKFNKSNIIFSPEFLREGKALYDNLYPSRIIVGEKSEKAKIFVEILKEGAIKKDIPILFTNSTEAEAIKLFSNTYLAMRVSYFNELDTYAEIRGLDTKSIIQGVCLDSRIGDKYNNPSFGYGGYCLPKDVKQLKANYMQIPNNIISAIVDSNKTRKEHIVNMILSKRPRSVGIYRLIMKANSDNFRESAINDIIKMIISKGIKVYLYEPMLKESDILGIEIIRDLFEFKEKSDIIVANRSSEKLKDVEYKVYTRDLFFRD